MRKRTPSRSLQNVLKSMGFSKKNHTPDLEKALDSRRFSQYFGASIRLERDVFLDSGELNVVKLLFDTQQPVIFRDALGP